MSSLISVFVVPRNIEVNVVQIVSENDPSKTH